MNSSFHVPVLSEEVLEYIISDKSGTYVDCTLGGGGHAELILKKVSEDATYIGIDQDREAVLNAKKKLSKFKNVRLIQDNFRNLTKILHDLKINKIDGLLLDLGVSSYQIDSAQRGFSYNVDTKLDMRMNQNDTLKAANILNEYSKSELTKIFFNYGEEKKSRSITNLIIKEREKELFKSTFQLRQIIEKVVNPKYKIKSFSRIFQAIRIEVNQELENLKMVLDESIYLLNKGGRLVIISYHSLEDRIAKQFFKHWENPCTCPKELPICGCGKKPEIKILTKKVIKALLQR